MAGEIQLNGTSFASESSGTITINNATLSSGVQFPGKIIKNIYIDSTGTSTGTTNSTLNKFVYSVSIPNPQTSYSYLIIGGIGGYVDSGESRLFGSLIKDAGLGTEAYIKDTISINYLLGISYNDISFFLNLNYYYEPNTSTAFTIDAAIRSDGTKTYSAPYLFTNQLIVLELGGN